MSKYKFDDDNRYDYDEEKDHHNDDDLYDYDEDKEHHDDDVIPTPTPVPTESHPTDENLPQTIIHRETKTYRDAWPVVPTPTPTPTPVPTPTNKTVEVVVNHPTVNIANNTTTINTVIENVIVNPPAPEPITNYIYGTRKNDYLTGTDLNDVIYGYQGNDTLIDGLGADKLYGAKGKNTYYCTADGQTDFIYVKRDNKADVIKSVGIEDRIDVKGSKFTFAETSAGIEIYYKHSLQAIYTGGELSLSQIQSITV